MEFGFEIEEILGCEWQEQIISYHLDNVDISDGGYILQGPEGDVDADFTRSGHGADIIFRTGLKAFEKKSYSVKRTSEKQKSPFFIDDDKQFLKLGNSVVNILIPASGHYEKGFLPAPISNMKGEWGEIIETGHIADAGEADVETKIIRSGNVEMEACVTYDFGEAGEYTVNIKMWKNSGDIHIKEKFSLENGIAVMGFSHEFPVDRVFAKMHTPGKERGKTDYFQRTRFKPVGELPLQPFYIWEKDTGTSASLKSDMSSDIVTILPVRSSKWRNGRANLPVLEFNEGKTKLRLPLKKGERQWVMSISPVEEDIKEIEPFAINNPYNNDANIIDLELKHSHHAERMSGVYNGPSLQKYIEFTCKWPGMGDLENPRLLIKPGEIGGIRERIDSWSWMKKTVKDRKQEFSPYDPAGIYLATGEEKYAIKAREAIREWIRSRLYLFVKFGYTVHSLVCISFSRPFRNVVLDYDIASSSPVFDDESREWFLSAIAFLTNVMRDRDYWPDEESGFSRGNINFHSDMYTCLGCAASLLVNHPLRESALSYVEGQLEKELNDNIYPGGAWAEAPNYHVYSLNYLLICAIALKNAGRRDFFNEPKLLDTLIYLCDIQTPVDPRCGYALLPTVGDTHISVWSQSWQVVLAWAAKHTIEKNPDISKKLMGAWKKGGGFIFPYVPQTLAMTFTMALTLVNTELPSETEEEYKSVEYPGFGAVLKNGGEGYLLFKCGPASDHYDHDEGSIIWYEKGVPLLTDYGTMYFPNTDQAFLHNRISIGHKSDRSRGEIEKIRFSDSVDFIRAKVVIDSVQKWPDLPDRDPDFNFRLLPPTEEIPPHVWTRDIIYLKDIGALYINDRIEGAMPTDWNIQVLADKVGKTGYGFLFKCLQEKEMAVFTDNGQFGLNSWEHKGLDEEKMNTPWRQYLWMWDREITAMGEKTVILSLKDGPGGTYPVLLVPLEQGEEAGVVIRKDNDVVIWEKKGTVTYIFCPAEEIKYRDSNIMYKGGTAVVTYHEDGGCEVVCVDGKEGFEFSDLIGGADEN